MFNFLRLSSILVSSLFAIQAFAADGDMLSSEYLHQANAGSIEITPGIGQAPGGMVLFNSMPSGYSMSQYATSGTNEKYNVNMVPVILNSEFGLSSMFSVGVQLGYGSGTSQLANCPDGIDCSSHYIKGFYDPALFFKGRASLGSGVLMYGIVADINLQKADTSSTGDGNLASGGSSVTPFVAYQMPFASTGIWGVRFQYQAYRVDQKSTDESQNPTQNSTRSGGNSWAVDTFCEAPVGGMLTLGGAVFFSSTPESKVASDGGPSVPQNDAYRVMGFEFYAPIHLANLTILPNLSYQSVTYTSYLSPVTSGSNTEVGLAARMAF